MASKNLEKVSLKIEYSEGLVDGKEKFSSKNFNNIKLDATDQNLLEFSTIVENIQDKDLSKVYKLETSVLSE